MSETTETKKGVKFCVASFTDLLGFSAHLETGSDLRTNIGEQAIDRLQVMEDVIGFITEERAKHPHLYPEQFFYARINDALVLTMDLPEQFMPEIGRASTRSVSQDHMDKLFEKLHDVIKEDTPPKDFYAIVNAELSPLINDLCLFAGIVARTHQYVSKKESAKYFPGPKTVVSTGYRKPFIKKDGNEDFLSANFAFSNAYIAESKLKGSKIYFDNHILQLLSISPFGKNMARYALLITEEPTFDPAKDYDDILFINHGEEKIPAPIPVELFRKQYIFREVSLRPLVLLQLLPTLIPYLKREKQPNPAKFFGSFFTAVSAEVSFEELKKNERPIFNWMYCDISSDIILLQDRLIDNDSKYLKEFDEKRQAEQRHNLLTGALAINYKK